MSTLYLHYDHGSKSVIITKNQEKVINGFEAVGAIDHGDPDPLGWEGNHVLWHHIRRRLYQYGVTDMDNHVITYAEDETIPITPAGPLDFVFPKVGNDFRAQFQLDYPNALLMVISANGIGNNVNAKHGDDELELIYRSSAYGISVNIFKGTNLTLETAELAITCPKGYETGPVIGRIIDFAGELITGPVKGLTANNSTSSSSASFSGSDFIPDAKSKAIYGAVYGNIPWKTNADGPWEIMFWSQAIAGNPLPQGTWNGLGDTWSQTGETGLIHTGAEATNVVMTGSFVGPVALEMDIETSDPNAKIDTQITAGTGEIYSASFSGAVNGLAYNYANAGKVMTVITIRCAGEVKIKAIRIINNTKNLIASFAEHHGPVAESTDKVWFIGSSQSPGAGATFQYKL